MSFFSLPGPPVRAAGLSARLLHTADCSTSYHLCGIRSLPTCHKTRFDQLPSATESVLRSRGIPDRWLLVMAGILTLSGANVEAQDALQSALSIANIIESKRTDKPIVSENIRHLGPILYGVGLYSSVEYQDNGN